MTARNFWLVVCIWCLLLGLLVTCSGVCGGEGGGIGAASADGDVDLEAVTDEYKAYVKSGAETLTAFEEAVNAKGLYKGEGHVSTEFAKDGAVVGFVDKDGDKQYAAADQLVFKIEADQPKKQLIASDRHHRHYRVGAGDIFGLYLLSRMFDRHRTHYGGWHDYGYRSYVGRGYYRSLPSRRFGSRSWGGGGGSSRSFGRGGGWGGGK